MPPANHLQPLPMKVSFVLNDGKKSSIAKLDRLKEFPRSGMDWDFALNEVPALASRPPYQNDSDSCSQPTYFGHHQVIM